MAQSRCAQPACSLAFSMPRVKRVFWKSKTVCLKALRSLVNFTASSKARWAPAWPAMAICSRSCGSWFIR